MPTIKEAAYNVLKKEDRPMTVQEITELVKKQVVINSNTPEKTVNHALQKHTKVERVGRATFVAIK